MAAEFARFIAWRFRVDIPAGRVAIVALLVCSAISVGQAIAGIGGSFPWAVGCCTLTLGLVFVPGVAAVALRLIEGVQPRRPWNQRAPETS